MTVDFGPGESLIVSHDLPVLSQVTECPYLALILSLDVDILRSLMHEVGAPPATETRAATLDVGETEESP